MMAAAASCRSPGDKVLFQSYAAETIKIDDHEYLLMSEDGIFAVVE